MPCMCGDTECPSCGMAQGTLTIKTVCCICQVTIREGYVAPDGGVSHGFCIPCAQNERAKVGLPPFTEEELELIKEDYR